MSPPDTIAVVVDPDFGDSLFKIADRIPVWICASRVNLQAAQAHWAQRKLERVRDDNGATTFGVPLQDMPEDTIIGNLSTIDEHHAWARIEVYGVGATPRLRQELQEYGVSECHETRDGFVCSRAEPTEAR